MHHTDLVIVGGGPAGLATAVFAARSGLSSLVIDKRSLPLDKPCGEGVMPPGVALLEEMGVSVPHASFEGIRYVDGDIVAEGRFQGSVGWGVRRTELVRGLVDRARQLGVELRYGENCTEWSVLPDRVRLGSDGGDIEGKYLIAADGLHSRLRKEAGLNEPTRAVRRFGVRRHFRARPWSSCVEVHWTEGAEAYVTPVGVDELGVAFLSSGEPKSFEARLGQFPELQERLGGAMVTSEARGAGPFRQRVRRRYQGRLALVGDAAGYLDAITGEGLSLAFRTAGALVAAIADHDSLTVYEAAYRRLSRSYYWTTGLLLAVGQRPRLRRALIASLAEQPEIFDRLLAISTGESGASSLGFRGAIGLLGGMLSRRTSSRVDSAVAPPGRAV
jgi:flavin-dependent dehydrogenase